MDWKAMLAYITGKEYVTHHHHERNHQGKEDLLAFPADEYTHRAGGRVRSRERLGGVLKYYYRDTA